MCEEDQRCKIEFKKSLVLTCGESWVSLPSHIELMNGSRHFAVKLDTDSLSPGAHFTEVSPPRTTSRILVVILINIRIVTEPQNGKGEAVSPSHP